MSWNYRIVQHDEGWMGLHEVYYNDNGTPSLYTAKPVGFIATEDEDETAIIESLELALRDARTRPVLKASDITGSKTEKL